MAKKKAAGNADSAKSIGARRKFASPAEARVQLEGITAAQERYRRGLRRRRHQTPDTDEGGSGIIIDSREKSEQAFKNALKAVRRPEDLNGFD